MKWNEAIGGSQGAKWEVIRNEIESCFGETYATRHALRISYLIKRYYETFRA